MKPQDILAPLYGIMDYLRKALIIGIFSFIVITGTLETFKQSYVKDKGSAWQDLYNKISAVK